MNRKTKNIIWNIVENLMVLAVVFVLSMTIVMMILAVTDKDTSHEASTGSFEYFDFNAGWKYDNNGVEEILTLPTSVDIETGEDIVITNTLPVSVSDGMHLMVRGSMQDVHIYIDGKEREEYTTESLNNIAYYVPSAYVVTSISKADAGKEIKLVFKAKGSKKINAVSYGYGNNVWFGVIRKGLAVAFIAAMVLMIGLLVMLATLIIPNVFQTNATRFLGLLMIDVSLWMFSESVLRQVLFKRASFSAYFAYLAVELIGVLVCMYFDEVQHKSHHKMLFIFEMILFGQIVLNAILHLSGLLEFYRTVMISHALMGLFGVIAIIGMIKDIFTGKVKEYLITAIGMILFILCALGEILGFIFIRFHQFGVFLGIGLVILMTATVIQAVTDSVLERNRHEVIQTKMTIGTIETIAGAIDARDEYTGGHSERVGLYAEKLARAMAADYDFSEEDILRIKYIGLVHDIGKIGVADNVLNKSGKLTDEEFMLMKKHAEIGYEIMSSLDASVEGLLDGIRNHHERFDGKGYPDGLSDTDIPLVARILALADSYDAMTSNRVYRKRLSDEQVRDELVKGTGTQFDPAIAPIFIDLLDRGELNPETVEGTAVDESGRVRASALLETRLQKDLQDKLNVLNPSHVRMLCYVMKLMEKKGKDYSVLFVSASEIPDLKKVISSTDTYIHYTEGCNVLALYDRSEEELENVKVEILKISPKAALEVLS